MKSTLSILLLAAAATPAAAADLATDFTGGATYVRIAFANYGWTFTTNEDRRLTALGLFDVGADGLADSHEVGIWDAGGSLVASTTVSSANPLTASTSSIGDWRFASVAPTILSAGTYTIGAYYLTQGDAFVAGADGNPVVLSNASWLTFDQAVTTTSEQFFTRPTNVIGAPFTPAFFGPNFQTTAVPEPAAWALMIAGFGLAGAAARRRPRIAYA